VPVVERLFAGFGMEDVVMYVAYRKRHPTVGAFLCPSYREKMRLFVVIVWEWGRIVRGPGNRRIQVVRSGVVMLGT